MSKALFDQIKRLLEYSGSKIKQVHETDNGSLFDVEFGSEDVRIYVVPKWVPALKNQPEETTYDY